MCDTAPGRGFAWCLMADSSTGGRNLALMQKREQVLALRLEGKSYREIASITGVARTSACEYVRDAMAEAAAEIQIDAASLVQIELERLDMAVAAIVDKVREGDIQAIGRWIRLSESRRKLLGLDAPEKLTVNNGDLDRQIERELEELRRAEQARTTGPDQGSDQADIATQSQLVPAHTDAQTIAIPPVNDA